MNLQGKEKEDSLLVLQLAGSPGFHGSGHMIRVAMGQEKSLRFRGIVAAGNKVTQSSVSDIEEKLNRSSLNQNPGFPSPVGRKGPLRPSFPLPTACLLPRGLGFAGDQELGGGRFPPSPATKPGENQLEFSPGPPVFWGGRNDL